MSSPVATRAPRADRCPGVLRLVEAADGHLARIRLPGGVIDADGLRALAALALELGDGRLELTSRGNVQLRGLPASAGPRLGDQLADAGLWPSESHEQIRNIVASPLAGIDNTFDLSPVVHELDAALRADARVVELSGRFLFALDDGRGDVAQLTSDVLAVVDGRKAWVEGRPVALAELATTMLAIAHAFLDERSAQQSGAWHIDGLTDGRQRVRARVNAAFNGADAQQPLAPTTIRTPIGRVSQPDGRWALVVAAPLGRVTAAQACWLADQLTGRPARITPWRSVVLPDIDDIDGVEAAAHDAGLVSHRDSPWFGISACAGRPRCPKALADVQQDAAASLGRWADRRVHWSGCERHCGRPANTQVDVLATNAGYRVTETEWSGPDV